MYNFGLSECNRVKMGKHCLTAKKILKKKNYEFKNLKISKQSFNGLIQISWVIFNPIALRKAKIVYNFGLSECNRVKMGKHCLTAKKSG